MQSILRQLPKYAPIVNTPLVEVPQRASVEGDDILAAIKRILFFPQIPKDLYDEELDSILKLMSGYSKSKFVGILFPLEIDIAYYLFYRCGKPITNEVMMNNLLGRFFNTTNYNDYMATMVAALDDNAKQSFLSRVLIATFNTERHKGNRDRLPTHYRGLVAQKLKCNGNIKDAVRLNERLNKLLSPEQLILGRICYLAFWHWTQNETVEQSNHKLLMLT